MSSLFLDPRKFRTPLHFLVTSFCARKPRIRTADSLNRFAEVLAVLTENADQSVKDADVKGDTALHLACRFTASSDVIKVQQAH